MIRVTLEMDCKDIHSFEEAMKMDEEFDLFDSIVWLLDYSMKDERTTKHNGITITVNEEAYELPYKGEH